jgi:glycosyltransferase involved in cell wall biosynthesis
MSTLAAAVRVLIVTNMWPTPERPALGSFVRDQVEALERIDGVEVEVYKFIPAGGLAPYATAYRDLRKRYAQHDFDIVHAHYGLTAWSALGVKGAPRVVTYHGTDLGHRVAGPLGRRVLNLVDLPATASRWLALRQGGGIPGAGTTRRVAVLPTGVNLARFARIDRKEAREQLGLDPAKPYLLFPSDASRPEKRVARARLVAEAVGAPLLTYDSLAPERVPLMINAANALLVTSEREGFGLACLEALACDVPVLSTDVGIAPLALKGVAGTLVGRFDRDEWAAAVRPHVESDDPRVRGRARAALFDSNRMAMRVFHAYRALLDEGAR